MGLFNFFKPKPQKSELGSFLDKIGKEMFPNGKKDIDAGINELLRILNYKIEASMAQTIFIRSSSICYMTGLRNEFSKERLKRHLAPYALQYFDEAALEEFYIYLRRNNKITNDCDIHLNQAREYAISARGNNATDKDIMPEGYGEFGLEITNPVPTRSIPDGYHYLNCLRTTDGSKITYSRIGSMSAPNINQIIDGYKIYVQGNQIATIYICPYNKKNSSKAPKGFILMSNI
jgi:hypothetical protein